MRKVINATFALCLFGSIVLAGDMTTGGYQCPPEGCPPPPCTQNCGDGNGLATGSTTTEVIIVLAKELLKLRF
jgi:hypothetical protein